MTIILAIAILLAALVAYAATRPDDFRIERSATMQASPDKVYAQLVDFHNWAAWSPWEKMDPAMQRSFSGTPQGVGTIYGWVGNKKVGEGRMEILEATAPSALTIKLDFFKPFEAHNTALFTLTPVGSGTTVLWAMTGSMPFMMKLMGVFMSMDKMVGKDFEAGLANLKALVEK